MIPPLLLQAFSTWLSVIFITNERKRGISVNYPLNAGPTALDSLTCLFARRKIRASDRGAGSSGRGLCEGLQRVRALAAYKDFLTDHAYLAREFENLAAFQNVYPSPAIGAGFACRPPLSSRTRTLAVTTNFDTLGNGRIFTPAEALVTE